jgi:hypothetical protein
MSHSKGLTQNKKKNNVQFQTTYLPNLHIYLVK